MSWYFEKMQFLSFFPLLTLGLASIISASKIALLNELSPRQFTGIKFIRARCGDQRLSNNKFCCIDRESQCSVGQTCAPRGGCCSRGENTDTCSSRLHTPAAFTTLSLNMMATLDPTASSSTIELTTSVATRTTVLFDGSSPSTTEPTQSPPSSTSIILFPEPPPSSPVSSGSLTPLSNLPSATAFTATSTSDNSLFFPPGFILSSPTTSNPSPPPLSSNLPPTTDPDPTTPRIPSIPSSSVTESSDTASTVNTLVPQTLRPSGGTSLPSGLTSAPVSSAVLSSASPLSAFLASNIPTAPIPFPKWASSPLFLSPAVTSELLCTASSSSSILTTGPACPLYISPSTLSCPIYSSVYTTGTDDIFTTTTIDATLPTASTDSCATTTTSKSVQVAKATAHVTTNAMTWLTTTVDVDPSLSATTPIFSKGTGTEISLLPAVPEKFSNLANDFSFSVKDALKEVKENPTFTFISLSRYLATANAFPSSTLITATPVVFTTTTTTTTAVSREIAGFIASGIELSSQSMSNGIATLTTSARGTAMTSQSLVTVTASTAALKKNGWLIAWWRLLLLSYFWL